MWLFGKKKEKLQEVPAQDAQVQAFAQRFRAEEFTLVAVTGPEGLDYARGEGEKLWTVSVPLTAWMDEFDAVVHAQPARLEMLADERLRDYLGRRLPGNFIIKARVRPAVEGDAFQLTGMPEPGFDPELKAILDEQVKPVTLESEALGTFTLNRAVDQFQAEADWLDGRVLLVFGREEDADQCLACAEALLAQAQDWDGRLRAFAADRLLDAVNALSAEDEDAQPLTRDELLEQLEPETVQVGRDGSVAVWLGGEPLWGQTIRVMGTLEHGPADARLEE